MYKISHIEDLTSSLDPTSNFSLVVLQTELERIKFLLRSFLRTRLSKMDKYPLHYLQTYDQWTSSTVSSTRHNGSLPPRLSPRPTSSFQHDGASSQLYRHDTTSSIRDESNDRENEERNPLPPLSDLEVSYLRSHQALLSKHYAASFLASFPAQLQKLDDTGGGISMVDAPDLDTAVFIRVLRDVEQPVMVHGEQGEGEVDLRRGGVWVLRWRDVRVGVISGDLELL